MSSLIHAGRATATRPSPAVPSNVLSAYPRRPPDLYDDAKGPACYVHDNEYDDFRKIRILPTTDEILAVDKPIYIPKKDLQQPNPIPPSPERLQDLLFRQLRYDSLEHVRDICYSAAQIAFLCLPLGNLSMSQNVASPAPNAALKMSPNLGHDGLEHIRQETLACNRYFLYRDVHVEEMVPHEQKSILVRISYNCPRFMQGRLLHKTCRFEEGMLIALLCLNNHTRELDVSFLQIHRAQSTDSMKPRGGEGCKAAWW